MTKSYICPARSLSGTMVMLAAAAGSLMTPVMADTFGTGGNEFTIDFVRIGNPGNAADSTGLGAVPYGYQMGTYEVSRDMITKANSAGGLGITLQDMSGFWGGSNVGTRPATGLSWFEAAKFVNWLNTSSGHTAAYNFNGPGNSFTLWTPAEAWTQGGENLYRNKDAHYFLPSENEWYKAAYHNGTGYFAYPTGADTRPAWSQGGTQAGTAVFNKFWPLEETVPGPADITNAGGLSPYGTMGQGGNVDEWMESAYIGANDLPLKDRGQRGGSWIGGEIDLLSVWGGRSAAPSDEISAWGTGFRVAAVPEPLETAGVFGALALGLALWRRRDSLQ